MLDTILTIAFFTLLFGGFGFVIYSYAKKFNSSEETHFAVKDPNKFGCH